MIEFDNDFWPDFIVAGLANTLVANSLGATS